MKGRFRGVVPSHRRSAEIPDAEGSTETEEPRPALLADLLVTKAKQTSARVSFIEDAALLAGVDGIGAFLRWV